MCSQMRLRTASSRTCNCTLHSSCTHKLLLNLLMMDDALINNNLYFVFALRYCSFSLSLIFMLSRCDQENTNSEKNGQNSLNAIHFIF